MVADDRDLIPPGDLIVNVVVIHLSVGRLRIWDVPPRRLCRKHLLGEHVEAHAIWSILTRDLKGYSRHPEVLRWKGNVRALYLRHQTIGAEMERRGFSHRSPLDARLAIGSGVQRQHVDSLEEQRRLLRSKDCECGPRYLRSTSLQT